MIQGQFVGSVLNNFVKLTEFCHKIFSSVILWTPGSHREPLALGHILNDIYNQSYNSSSTKNTVKKNKQKSFVTQVKQ